MEFSSKIFIAGARGLVGSAVVRRLHVDGYHNLLTPTREELDLTSQSAVNAFFLVKRPEFVFLVAGKGVSGSALALSGRFHPRQHPHPGLGYRCCP